MGMNRFFAASLLLLSACSHTSKHTEFKAPGDYQEKLYQKIGAEMAAEANSLRAPANEGWQLKTLKAQLGDFNKLRPGKFEIYVFPKIKTTSYKEVPDDTGVLLGKPQVAEVSILANTTCDAFLNRGAFAKLRPASYFARQLGQDKKNTCAIVEVTSRTMKDLNKSLLREGDVFAKRIYLDSSYNVYGIETDFYSRSAKQNENNMKTVGLKLEAGSHSTSGLDFLPVDLPALSRVDALNQVVTNQVFSATAGSGNFTFKSNGTVVDRLAIRQISRLNKNFSPPKCSLRKISYKDHFRKSVEMYWCEGQPWPAVVDSLQFVAVTQNLSVR